MLKVVGFPCILTVACLCSGCGTAANLVAPIEPADNYRACGPASCEPFGGVERSVGNGTALITAAPVTPIGVVAGLAVIGIDAPLSLLGDVVTLPVVFFRQLNEGVRHSSEQIIVP
jgi:uncharacterized protein YceK